MNFITFFSILVICDLCMVIPQSAGSRAGGNYPRNSRSGESYIKKLLKSRKQKRKRSSQDEEIIKRGRPVDGGSAASGSRTEKAKMDLVSQGETKDASRKKIWTNEEYNLLLRQIYSNYNSKVYNRRGAIDWKPVIIERCGEWDTKLKDSLRNILQMSQEKMRKAVENYNNGGIKWSRKLDDHLLNMYFITEAGDESKHAERIHDKWLEEYPHYDTLTPAYLLNRAETMLSSVMKFSLDNPRGKIKTQQVVDWKPEHNRLLRSLFHQLSKNIKNPKQQLYNEAVKRCSAMQVLGEDRVYRHAKYLCWLSAKNHEEINSDEESLPDTTHAQYHSFMDDQNFPSLDLGTHSNRARMASTSSQPRSSHRQAEPDLDLNISHSERRSPDTNLYLGYQAHDDNEN